MVDKPRVLFVTPVAFNPYSGSGATFASLFEGWPKDRLATVHNDPAPTSSDVCERYFFLGPDELDFVWPFSTMRRARKPAPAAGGPVAKAANRPRWMDGARRILLGDSIPERARLTPALKGWIAEFRPEVLYTTLGGNGMMALVEQIREQFGLPLVVHIMDDWPNAAHRRGLFAPIERPRMKRHIERIFAAARTCLGICAPMCEAYTRRYGRAFVPFQYALDLERWSAIHKRDLTPAQPPQFLYIGSIFRNAQLDSLVDCARAIAELNAEGFAARLRIVTSADNCARYRHLLELHPNITVEASASGDDEFFHSLADADALLLPVNFDGASIDFIRYSMPTKVPAYLNSATPALVYGPMETAQVRYAVDSHWALVVAERSREKLKAALKEIVQNQALRHDLSAAARKAAANHDARVVRYAFQELLTQSKNAGIGHTGQEHRADRARQTEQTRRFFDTVASGWAARYNHDAGIAERKARFLDAVQATCPAPADILDFGCGSGDIARHLAAHGYRLTGYDLSEAMIGEARRADRGARVRWLARAPAETTLPFADASFDATVASSVLEYVPDVTAALKQLSRTLRPGGWLFATVPDMRDATRRRETVRRWAATTPGLGALLRHTRWREGADYLRISVNRDAPETWLARLREAGLSPEDLPESTGPLLLLAARKT